MPLTASKIATCISTYTRAVITAFPLTAESARTAFSALRFHFLHAEFPERHENRQQQLPANSCRAWRIYENRARAAKGRSVDKARTASENCKVEGKNLRDGAQAW